MSVKLKKQDKPRSTLNKVNVTTNNPEMRKKISSSKHLILCNDISHGNKAKEMMLMKEKVKDEKVDGKEGGSSSSKQTDLYSSLTPEKTLQCAIILAEINRKFASQNFKPA